MKNLAHLSEIYMTDKRPSEHNYAKYYDLYFSEVKNTPLTLLEIGVLEHPDRSFGAASLRMWADYFPNAEIHGIDIKDLTHLQQERIRIYIGSQENPERLQSILRDNNIYPNIIIDDGSHKIPHQLTSLSALFRNLSPGGIYVIEDIVQFDLRRTDKKLVSDVAKFFTDDSAVPMDFTSNTSKDIFQYNTTLAVLMRYCISGQIHSDFINPDDSKYLADNIELCNIHRSEINNLHIAFISKKNTNAWKPIENQEPTIPSTVRGIWIP